MALISDPQQFQLEYQPLQDHDHDPPSAKPTTTKEWKPLYLATVCIVGTGVAWAVQFTYCTPTFRELGLSDAVVNYTWLAAPITGIVVQPIVGVYNDHSTFRWGRRRLSMLIGAICTAIGLEVFCNAKGIGYWFGDTDDDHMAAIVIAMLGLWLLDASINVMQAPQRALLSDLFPESHLPLANAFGALHLCLGMTLGYGLGAIDLVSWAGLSWMGSNVRALYTLGAVVALGSTIITCVTTPERQYHPEKGGPAPHPAQVMTTILRGTYHMPKSIQRAFAVQLFAYVSWYFTDVYASDWVGEEIFGGSADSNDSTYALYERGVRVASLGCALKAGGAAVWALFIPKLCAWFGRRLVWASCLAVFATSLLCTLAVQEGQTGVAVLLLGLLSIPCAATHSIPWTIVTQEVASGNDGGLYTAIFNLSEVTMEIFVALVGGCIYSRFGSVAADLAAGGVAAFIAMCLCYFVVNPGPQPLKQVGAENRPAMRQAIGSQEMIAVQLRVGLTQDSKDSTFL